MSSRFKTSISVTVFLSWLLTLLTSSTARAKLYDQEQVALASCAARGGTPLSKADFGARIPVKLREAHYNAVETIFENFALRSFQLTKFKPAPQAGVPPIYSPTIGRTVVPDAVDVLYHLIQQGKKVELIRYENSVFYDAKSKQGRIGLNDTSKQIMGFIDALANSPAAKTTRNPRPLPRLIFMTISDSFVADDTYTEANKRQVAIYQSVVCSIPIQNRNQPNTVMGAPVRVNPQVYQGKGIVFSTDPSNAIPVSLNDASLLQPENLPPRL
ncbi:hypothetical protein F7734_52025 [Scytonema sp. UIC 10036]|uniref:hypothetical protein n=1 Tax=Scytonema sp. UIC 10036 TaxID=2304196 RepID=UPI0012DAEB13|nr:hypothetical protein [Scytonema sp. UIC 10036]MUH00352.1 hypothetical protein [Scytonema sp. UIC 10036]